MGRSWFELLTDMVGMAWEPRHSNVKEVVERVIEAWHAFEKTLSFSFRNDIARRARDILNERLTSELSAHAWRCLEG